jgi:hypothetical protein
MLVEGFRSLISSVSIAFAFYFIFSNFPLPLPWGPDLTGFIELLLGLLFGVITYTVVSKLRLGYEATALITSLGIMVTTYFVFGKIEFPWGIEVPNVMGFFLGILLGAVTYAVLVEIFRNSNQPK